MQTETKKVIEKFDNGIDGVIFYYKDKNDTLTYRKEVFFESGKQNYIGDIIDNKKEGVWTWWYENGRKKDQCKYLNGREVDTIFHWYANGQLKQMDVLRQGKTTIDNPCSVCCNATTMKYDENGNLKETFTKVDDIIQGAHTTYEENGSWKMKTYKNDTLNGATIEFLIDSTGIKLVNGQYANGKESGVWKWFDKDSSLYQTAVYEDGEFNGEYIEFYKNGKIKSSGNLIDGIYNGEVKYYDEDGHITETAK